MTTHQATLGANSPSKTRAELSEAPEKVREFLHVQKSGVLSEGRRLGALAPKVILTSARGTSDHATTFLKYGVEIGAGIPVASIGPSIASIYGAQMKLEGAVCISISQSGRSPDLIAFQQMAREQGAETLALVNDVSSPLAGNAHRMIPLLAGPELGIAATKSYICTLTAMACLVAGLTADTVLEKALDRLPDALDQALAQDWSQAADVLMGASSFFVLGRGPAFSLAQEVALKFKEMTGQHAEAYSLAEVMHGPLRMVVPGFPILALTSEDATGESTNSQLSKLADMGANVLAVGRDISGCKQLGTTRTGHALTDVICDAMAFYNFIEAYTQQIGLDPDNLPGLRKVTMTV